VLAGVLFYAKRRLSPAPLSDWTIETELENPVAFPAGKATGFQEDQLPKIFR
jgi:hypothetical protein